MPIVEAKPEFVCGAVNTTTNCISWSDPKIHTGFDYGLIAYGVQNWVALVDPIRKNIISTLLGHTGRVNSVSWFGTELVSASSDNTLRVWAVCPIEGRWVCTDVLKFESEKLMEPVMHVTAQTFEYHGGSYTTIAASTRDCLRMWLRYPDDEDEDQDWYLIMEECIKPTVMIECLSSFTLDDFDDKSIILAAGCVDSKIHLWKGEAKALAMKEERECYFTKVGSLAGHQDWVRSLAIRPCVEADGSVLLASGSNDSKIRIWKFQPSGFHENDTTNVEDVIDKGGNVDDDDDDVDELGLDIKVQGIIIDEEHEVRLMIRLSGPRRYTVIFDAMLIGHEEPITGLCWHPAGFPSTRTPVLLSSSMDRTMLLWKPESENGAWTSFVRLGDIGSVIGGAVGGNLLGFMGAKFSPDGSHILGYGFAGSFHLWAKVVEESREEKKMGLEDATAVEGNGDEEEITEGDHWAALSFMSGHFGPVSDVVWEPHHGRYLISVSLDQTARLYTKQSNGSSQGLWYEMSRPQIHGYDLTTATLLPSVEHRLISGADEKIIRVFDATAKVVDILASVAEIESKFASDRMDTAYLPELGLSNKAIGSGKATVSSREENDVSDAQGYASTDVAKHGDHPLENQLVAETLWPETHKLYGHGNEVIHVCSNHSGSLLASSCKARDAETAAIRTWDPVLWTQKDVIQSHGSTVVEMEFSHDDNYLTSVSKDRSLCLYSCENDKVTRIHEIKKAHKRIIWSCSWSFDDKLVATGSRDGQIKIWKLVSQDNVASLVELCQFFPSEQLAVTQLAFAPAVSVDSHYILAIGFESGAIEIWGAPSSEVFSDSEGLPWKRLTKFDSTIRHASNVKRIAWRPVVEIDGNETKFVLASCSSDHSVRIANVYVNSDF